MNKIFKISALSVVGLMLAVVITGTVHAVAEGTTAVFNAYDNVQLHYGVGSESDFLRLGESGEQGNTLEACENGQLIDLWFYVHNSTAETANGADFSGLGVATNTVIGLEVDEDAQSHSHNVVASIDSDQTNTITDGITITCADKDIQLVYKAVTHFGTKAPALADFGNFSLVGDLREGASLGYQKGEHEGLVPGCWQYRARLNVQLQIVEVVEEEEPEEEPEIETTEPEVEEPEEVTQIAETGYNAINSTLVMLVLGGAAIAAWGHRMLSIRRQ